MNRATRYGWLAVSGCSLAGAATPSEIFIPGQRLFTESLTSTADGAVLVSSIGSGAIYRAKPGASEAEVWIEPGRGGTANLLGIFADDRSNTLWVCSFTMEPARGVTPLPSALHAFDLSSGAPKGKWPLPTSGGLCNDIAVGTDGTAYVSDSYSMEILRLVPGAMALEVWAGHGAFGPKGGVLDGITIVKGHVVANTYTTGKLFSVPIGTDGKAGPVTEVKLDQPLKSPDGQRAHGDDGVVIVDGGEGGRLLKVVLSGEKLDTGQVTTLQAGFADGPASVTVVGDTAYVLEGQLDAMDSKASTKPFKAKGVKVRPAP